MQPRCNERCIVVAEHWRQIKLSLVSCVKLSLARQCNCACVVLKQGCVGCERLSESRLIGGMAPKRASVRAGPANDTHVARMAMKAAERRRHCTDCSAFRFLLIQCASLCQEVTL